VTLSPRLTFEPSLSADIVSLTLSSKGAALQIEFVCAIPLVKINGNKLESLTVFVQYTSILCKCFRPGYKLSQDCVLKW